MKRLKIMSFVAPVPVLRGTPARWDPCGTLQTWLPQGVGLPGPLFLQRDRLCPESGRPRPKFFPVTSLAVC